MSAETPELKIDVAQALDRASKVFMENMTVWLVAGMIMFVAIVIGTVISLIFGAIPLIGVLSPIVSFATAVILGVLMVGMLKMACDAMHGEKVGAEGLFYGFGKPFFPALVASLCILIIVSIGTVFCIIPGLILSVLYLHTHIFIVKGEQEFWGAMESSRKLVMANIGPWVIVYVVVLCLSLAGAAVCGVGLIAAFPFIGLFLAAVYESTGLLNGGESVEVEVDAEVTPPPAE